MPFNPHQLRTSFDDTTAIHAFNMAYEFLCLARLPKTAQQTLNQPSVVLAALAAELFMKANYIFKFHAKPPGGHDGHNLEKLFLNLSDEQKNDVKTILQTICNIDISKALPWHADLFKKYRYTYELTSVFYQMHFNLNFAEAVGAITYVNFVKSKNKGKRYRFYMHGNDRNNKYVKISFIQNLRPE